MTDDSESVEVFVPVIQGVRMGVTFFGDAPEPVIVMQMSAKDADGEPMTFIGAFHPVNLEALIPEIVEAVIRARTIMEMVTTWPEQREEILKNLAFRWTGHVEPGEDGINGAHIEGD